MRTGTSTTHSFSYYLAPELVQRIHARRSWVHDQAQLFPLGLITEDFGIIDTDTGSAQEPARNDPSQVNEINTT